MNKKFFGFGVWKKKYWQSWAAFYVFIDSKTGEVNPSMKERFHDDILSNRVSDINKIHEAFSSGFSSGCLD